MSIIDETPDTLLAYLRHNRPCLLAEAELTTQQQAGARPSNFYRQQTPDSDSAHFLRGDNSEAQFIALGRVASATDGTRHSAKGNHYINTKIPKDTKYITDNTTVKHLFMLELPRSTLGMAQDLYGNQLETMRVVCEQEPPGTNAGLPMSRPLRSRNRDGVDDLLAILIGPIYATPTDPPAVAGGGKVHVDFGDDDDQSNNNNNTADVEMEDANDAPEPQALDTIVDVGGFYPLSIYPDHRGTIFRHVAAKAVQLDVRDSQRRLIQPGNAMYHDVRTGTVITAVVTLHSNVFFGRKCLQLQAHSLRVWDESPIDADCVTTVHDHPLEPYGESSSSVHHDAAPPPYVNPPSYSAPPDDSTTGNKRTNPTEDNRRAKRARTDNDDDGSVTAESEEPEDVAETSRRPRRKDPKGKGKATGK